MITKEQADELIQTNDSFQKKIVNIQGTEIIVYNYNYASLGDFENSDYDYDAFEVRGLLFIKRPNGDFERSILLHKFFNCNQTAGYMYNDIKDKKVKHIQDKTDGSVISFVRLNNGNVVARSKTSFISDQAKAANELFKKDALLRDLVTTQLDKGNVAIFEYVSPDNRVVLLYKESKLVLLQIRSPSGEYLPLETNYEHVNPFHNNMTVDEITDHQPTTQGIEGWIVTYTDGQMVKFKTTEYCYLHKIKSDFSALNIKILTLNKEIDDIMPDVRALIPDKIDAVELIIHSVVSEYNSRLSDIMKTECDSDLSRKDFAIKYKGTDDFNCKMFIYSGRDNIEQMLKDNMTKDPMELEL